MLANAVQAEVEKVKDLDPDLVEVYLGKNYASGLYAWLIPKFDGKAGVGLAANVGNPKRLLEKLMRKHPIASKKLFKSKLSRISFHPIPLGGPISKTYSNGFLAVGDAASQVKPTTGGGVIFGMTCAHIAATIIHKAMNEEDFSSDTLSEYQRTCNETLGFDAKFMLKIRNMLNALSDDKIDKTISFCAKMGLDKTLQSIADKAAELRAG